LNRIQLEDWLRTYYFDVSYDLGSSGMEPLTLAELKQHTSLNFDCIEDFKFADGYSLGSPALRRCIAERWADGDPHRVMVTHGGSEAIYSIMRALLVPGDEVVVPSPAYPQFANCASACGAAVRDWPINMNSFSSSIASLASVLTSSTRMVVANFPNNPTGVSLELSQFFDLMSLLDDHACYLMWDAAFSELVYDRPPLPNPIAYYPRTIVIGTLSKAYGLPGLRIGWCIAAPQILDAMITVRDYTTLFVSPLAELVAAAALAQGDKLIAYHLEIARRNRLVLSAWAEDNSDQVEWTQPTGGVCCFPKIRALTDTYDFATFVAKTERVLVVPGSCFGCNDRIRLGFGCKPDTLIAGLERLEKGLRAYLGR
jgi:capreomycidine synthase